MAKSIRDNTKRPRGRPVTTGKGTLIGVRLQPAQLAALDTWIDQQSASLTRPEAIRAMMETILHILAKDTGEKPAKKTKRRLPSEGQKLRAREMAGKAIDRMADTTAHPNDQASRKHRLLKGPEEFREARVDRPKVKK